MTDKPLRQIVSKPSPAELDNWIPYKIERREEWLCRWLSVAGQSFCEPFFTETISKCQAQLPNGSRYASLSSLESLLAAAAQPFAALAPAAFIFHVSRCGSTLLAQLLGLSRQNVVLSEVPLLDQILRLSVSDSGIAPASVEALMSASLRLLARQRNVDEARLFVKLDSWHVAFAPLIRKLYPATPFVLLYRAPDEVMRSHRKRRGMQAVPGLIEPQLFDLSAGDFDAGDADGYLDKVLAYYLSRFMGIAAQDRRALLVDYRLGSMEMVRQVAAHAQFAISDADLASMEARSRFHSKYPDQNFSETPEASAASAVTGQAQAAYLQLEQMRSRQQTT
ncbi:MAG: hypothetical protein P4L91_11355 [Burkholderiaceae bacterium]|nr:hypothetical protein [Burkholderiaceae bacterium]